MTGNTCAACGAGTLVAHLRVKHPDGPVAELDLRPTNDRYGAALADLVRCPTCGHVQLAEFPSEPDLAAAYASTDTADHVGEEAGQRATARLTLDRIERWLPRRGRLLDLGCWVGFTLAEARDRGWEVVGVEPSAFAAAYARERLGLDVRREDLLHADLPERSFDAVFLGDVIEHLVDPGAALDRIARLLAPDGVLSLALPDAGSRLARRLGRRWWSVLPTHVQYFTRHSLTQLLTRHSYAPLHVATAPKTFSVGYYLWRIEGYSAPLSHAAIRAARATRMADRLWAPDFRDRIGVVARAPG